MPTISAANLKKAAQNIFQAAGATSTEAGIVADSLVGANLAGHDSHGVMRIPEYVDAMEKGLVSCGAKLSVVTESESFAVVDGGWGFGQVMARQAMDIGMAKAARVGVATVFGRNCCHIGRVGEYPEIAAARGMAAVMFVNTHGGGKLVAPWGGMDRRLSANPIAIGLPRASGDPILVDISTCAIAEGKLRNMRTADAPVPAGAIVDSEGRPSTDANDFYGPPQGAILPFGGHKGFALGLATDILAGALSGAGCSRPDTDRVGNSFTVTVIDVARVRGVEDFEREVGNLMEYVKSSRRAPGVEEILAPGEPESRERKRRTRDGIAIHPATWDRIVETAGRHGVTLEA
jgi:uncharacterized oxidoreductase